MNMASISGGKIFGKYNYSRSRGFLKTGTIIKLIDHEGNYNIFKIGRREPIGSQVVSMTSGATGVAAGISTEFAEFKFVEPGQENRLFHFRPILFAVRRSDLRFIFPHIPDKTPPSLALAPGFDAEIPMGVSIQVKDPAGTWRWGTDIKRDVLVNPTPAVVITNQGIGGVDGGYLEAELAMFLDDPSELWDVFTLFGHTIEFRLNNRTNFFWPPGMTIGGGGDTQDYFIGLIGSKYLLIEANDEVKKKVENREIDYQPIVISGIPTVTTRA